MTKPTTAAQRKRVAARARKFRLAHPDRVRESGARYRAAHPLTDEDRARKAENNRAWRAKNAAKIKRYAARRWAAKKAEVNARRRKQHAENPVKFRERMAAWKAAHPGHSRAFYHRHREKFTGDGPWSSRAKKLKRAWRKFTSAAIRRASQPAGVSAS